nr:reverse transcriptase domain-containing protein [Tanacetum cinerariifolium]
MSTRSTSSNLFSPLRDPESLIRRRNLGEPSSLFDFEETMSIPHNNQGPHPAGPPPQYNNGPPPVVRPNGPVPDLRSMEELCQPFINGWGGLIAPIPIQATDFGLRHHMFLQVQNSYQFHRLPGDDANRHIDKFLEVTQHMKQNGVSDDALRLSLFPYSLAHHATAGYDRLPRNSIQSFDDMMRRFLSKYFPHSMVTKLRNKIMNFRQDPNESLIEIDTLYNGLTLRHWDTINDAAEGTFMKKRSKECNDLIKNMTAHHNHWDTSAARDKTSRTISSTTTTESPEVVRSLEMMNKNFQDMMRQIQLVKSVNPKCKTCGDPYSYNECLAIGGYTQEAAYATMGNHNSGANPRGDMKAITTHSVVAYDGPMIPPTSSPLLKEVKRELEVTKDKVQNTSSESIAYVQPPVVQVPIPKPDVVSKPNSKLSIPFPLRLNDQNFADAFLHMPKFASTFKSLPSNKEKLFELASTLLNENCSAVLLKKLPQKLEDPGKFLISCDFLELEVCLALADLGSSINLMPLFIWKNLSIPEVTPTRMTLKLTNRSVAYPVGVAKDVFVKVGKFYFSADFVVVDYDVDPRVPLISERPFLRMTRPLIDVHYEELTLRVNDEAITFNFGDTSRYSRNYYDELVNQINVIDVACEDYAQKVLGFSNSSTSGNPTPSDPIIASFSSSLTPFVGGDFILEEIKTFLHPSLNLPSMKNEDLKQADATMTKPSIEEPLELELKDLPSHIEYAFLEGTDKLPVIISKELKYEEKATPLKVLKLHNQAIAWKICDIKGIDPCFCTHKILMEDNFKPTVQL